MTNNCTRRNIERRLKIENSTNRKLTWSRDCNRKWNRNVKCSLRREGKKESIFRRCLLKTKDRNRLLPLRKKRNARKTSKLNRNILEC